jgi:hypothetical protein
MLELEDDIEIAKFGQQYYHHQFEKIYDGLINLPGFEDVKAKLIAKLMNLISKAELDQKIFFFWCLIMDK